jgi:hypothetical protein
MQGISIIEAKTEERPYFFDFKKYEIMGDHPTWAKLTYDPYPDASMEDVVRTEIISRELVLTAKLKVEDVESRMGIRPGIALEYQGNKFAIKESHFSLGSPIVEVEGSCFLTSCEPTEALARLREMLAASNPKS